MPMPQGYLSPEKILLQCMDTNGDESGDCDAIGDYSVTETDFFIAPPAGLVYQITRIQVFIESDNVIASKKYGSLAELTNGIKVIFKLNGQESQILKYAVKTHDDWASVAHDAIALNYGNVAGKSISVRWETTSVGTGIWLNGDLSHKFAFRFNDDFDGLTKHRFLVQGLKHQSSI